MASTPIPKPSDPRYAKALGHPLRVRILALLQERTASPRELAEWLDATLGTVSYHVRTLHDFGLIELVSTSQVRGAIAHHYRSRVRPRVSDEAWASAAPVVKQAAVGAALQTVDDYARASAAVGGFDRGEAHLSRTNLRLDERGWQAAAKACEKLLADIVALLTTLGLLKSDESRWVILRRTRGQLVTRSRDGTVRVTANGRGDWIGWLELKREAVNEDATRNTARVVGDMAADVLAVIEAEDRPALQRFNEDVLPFGFAQGTPAWRYRHVMLIDGNDDRGIDLGLTRDQFAITRMRSHVDDLAPNGEGLFSRDCPEYELALPGGKSLLVLVNHFKSKGHGTQASNNARRLAEATRVAEIYKSRRGDGWKRVAVVGDLNDTPASAPLGPLLNGTDLKDVSQHPSYIQDGRTGTFQTSKDKFDYLLLSPELFGTLTQAGLNRKGVWHGPKIKNPWPMLPTLTKEEQAASDLAAIWADIAL